MSKVCTSCKQTKSHCEFGKHKLTKDGLNTQCKECCNLKTKKWKNGNPTHNKEQYEKNKDKLKEQYEKNKNKFQQYYKDNKEKIIKRNILYTKNQYKINPTFRLRILVASQINNQLRKTENNKSKSSLKIVGLESWNNFRKHIESLWVKGMSWDNYGVGANNTTWHIDHIIPISLAKTEEDIYKLNHYTNLRPMWCSDNIRKSNKYLED